MAGDAGLNAFWTIFIAMPVAVGFTCFGYWVYRSVELSRKFAKYLKSLLIVNWIAVGAFFLDNLMVAIETIRALAIGKDFSEDFEEEDLQPTLALASLGYIVGKWSVYCILYLRLYYTLNKSAYSYNSRAYKMIKWAIVAEVFFTLLALALFVVADDGPIYLVAQLSVIPFFLLDVGIPITLNVMFIKKTHQIGKTYFRISSKTSRGGDSASIPHPSKSKTNSNEQSDPESGKTSEKNTQGNENPLRAQSTSASLSEEDGDKSGKTDGGAETEKQEQYISEENEKELGDLFDSISKVAVLAVIICASSIAFFVVFIISTTSTALLPLLWWSSTADSACNMVCVVLAFDFARKWFDKFCKGCQSFCKSQVAKKVVQ